MGSGANLPSFFPSENKTEGRGCLLRRRVSCGRRGDGEGEVGGEMIERVEVKMRLGNGPLLTSFSQVDDVAKRSCPRRCCNLIKSSATSVESTQSSCQNSNCKRRRAYVRRNDEKGTYRYQLIDCDRCLSDQG